MKRGARVLEFTADEEGKIHLNTWIRQEDGSVISQQPLKPSFLK
jgi:hypothetical protein